MVARRWMVGAATAMACLVEFSLSATAFCADPLPARRAKAPARVEPATPKAASRPFQAERLIRLFRTNREVAQLDALREIERHHLGHPDLPEALWQAIEPAREGRKVTVPLLAAVHLFAALDAESLAERQLALLGAGDIRVVLTSADALAERQLPAALPRIAALRERPEYRARYAVRHAVVSAVARFDNQAAVDALLATLATCEGQLKFETAKCLARLTGQNFGGIAADWKTWWAAHRDDDWKSFDRDNQNVKAALAGDMPWQQPVPRFFDLPIYAYRVVFVIDRSRSMRSSVDSVTRFDDAQGQLEVAVRGLSESTWFNILAYDTSLEMWREKLEPATVENKSASLRFIYAQSADHKTACYDALEKALDADPDLELIVFLSDGEPTAGKIVAPAQIVKAITARNAARRVSIDVLGIDAEGASEAFLTELARSNFGTYRPIR